ncbi:hypothetical protein RhiirC2_822383 [Rhizophagus irregularis]|uniref:Uncharacterized protein n=1 Tax=Rhizophagus irregularis TaxID=588596 RepID=A0A2N1MAW4_9GLOM|nr:hypothetical protein RhiirC2_799531 [Rhizophagus irregularis]PKK58215.1 hypothetical protein RhiirC2_796666 [Rhizophagus irregularis]PKK58224.1 hypothetical protein RhiirC2_720687 [Rhizophagus irregularis]PKK58759.1 hypothetical protein RhiirC2_822383 [Rhizophagus irregularis]
MNPTHEIFVPEVLVIHSEISSLSKEFKQLQLEYQTDNEYEFDKLEESLAPIKDSDVTDISNESSDELEQYDNDILTSAQIEKFKTIYDNRTTELNDDEQQQQSNIEEFLNHQEENAFIHNLQTKICCKKHCLTNNVNHTNALTFF